VTGEAQGWPARAVGEAGIEPTTPGLEGRCSIRLSYSPTLLIIVSAKSVFQECLYRVRLLFLRGAKARNHFGAFTARLKSCPDTSCFSAVVFPQALSDSLKVANDGGFGPVDTILGADIIHGTDTIPRSGTSPGSAAEEGAVAAVARLNEVDMGIGEDSLAGFGREADEGIVLGEEDERGNSYAVDDTRAGGAVVVVVCIAEAAVGSDDFLVEFADGAHRSDAAGLIDAGKKFRLVAEALHQCVQKMALIDEVGRRVQSVGTGLGRLVGIEPTTS
jgi:hypothetical protein